MQFSNHFTIFEKIENLVGNKNVYPKLKLTNELNHLKRIHLLFIPQNFHRNEQLAT